MQVAWSLVVRIDFKAANRAPVLVFEPGLDALCMELVEAEQSQNFLALLVVGHADAALVFIHLSPCCLFSTFRVSLAEDRSRQLLQHVLLQGLFIVAHIQLVHVLLELLLTHVCDAGVCPVLVTICEVVLIGDRLVVDQEFEAPYVWPESAQQTPDLFSLTPLLIAVRWELVRYGSLVHHSCRTCSF